MTVSLDRRLALRHRPAGLRPVLYQTWTNLVFMHWEIDPAIIQATLPEGLTVDTWDGRAYLGVVPFLMRHIRPRGLPALPWISYFREMNVRTYVYDSHGTPGVWFYSLDASCWPAVLIGRTAFHLPYFNATMSAQGNDSTEYRCRRRGSPKSSEFDYQFGKLLPAAEPESFEFFLTERYVMFTHDRRRNRLYSGLVHHVPYPLCEVDLRRCQQVVLQEDGFPPTGDLPMHVVGSRGVDVDVFRLEAL